MAAFRRSFLKSTTLLAYPELPLIVFGCAFHRGVCKACGLRGASGELVTCKLAETWALGKGHFRYARTREADI